jgi:hypothetical protein
MTMKVRHVRTRFREDPTRTFLAHFDLHLAMDEQSRTTHTRRPHTFDIYGNLDVVVWW